MTTALQTGAYRWASSPWHLVMEPADTCLQGVMLDGPYGEYEIDFAEGYAGAEVVRLTVRCNVEPERWWHLLKFWDRRRTQYYTLFMPIAFSERISTRIRGSKARQRVTITALFNATRTFVSIESQNGRAKSASRGRQEAS